MSGDAPAVAAHVRSFAYDDGAPPVLRDLAFSASAGTLTAVLGASGSGTSTLAKVIAGWATVGGQGRLDGSLMIGPRGVRPGARIESGAGTGDARLRLGAWGERVALVPQRAADYFSGAAATVGEELAFGLEQRGVPRGQMLARVAATARAVGLAGLVDRHPLRLSGGEQRRLAIGCALITAPDVLLLDDPEASLDADGLEALALTVDAEVASGTAVVLLTARPDGLAARAHRWVLLDGGTVAAEGSPAHVRAGEAFRASGVLDPDAAGPVAHATGRVPAPGAPAARLDEVHFAYPVRGRGRGRGWGRSGRSAAPGAQVLAGASLTVASGEVVAVVGPNGAGKSTALRHLAGLVQPDAGRVLIGDRDIAGLPAGRVAGRVGTLFQDPRDQLFERTALREVAFGLGGSGARTAQDVAIEALERVGLGASAATHPYDLPSSHQRLLALATVLARRPGVLALDEPTVGLDGRGRARLGRAVAEAAGEGAAVVLTTHDRGWAASHADRVVALRGGRFERA